MTVPVYHIRNYCSTNTGKNQNNIDNILSDNLLEDFFDGCIDPSLAQKTILFLSKNKIVRIIKNSRFARRHILFLDDIHIFTKEEKTVFNMILLQLKNGYSNSILLFSGEYFKSKKYILSYELKGMNTDDIIESLKANLIDMTYLSYKSTILSMPKQPQLLSELILFIQNNSQSKLPANNINNYILQITNNHLTNLDFDLLKEEKAIINIIYHFQKGVSKKLLHALKFNESTLDSLCTRGYLISYDNRYLPCYDYFYYTYLNTNAQIQPDKKMASILHLMLRNFSLDPLLDTIQVQALLIQYDIDMYKNLKIEFKEKITEYINKGYYKKAMLYGEIFCFDMLSRPSSSNNALEALFYFGISLIHCDSQRRAIDVFSYIKNNTPKDSILYYSMDGDSVTLIDEQQHPFKDIPIIRYINNADETGDYEPVLTLIDAYDKIQSDTANDFEELTDSFLSVSGVTLEPEQALKLKEMKVFNFPDANGKVEFVTKSVNDSALENFKTRLDKDIHKNSYTPNMSDENFVGNSSGVSMAYKLQGLEFLTGVKEQKFKKGLLRRVELLSNVLSIRANQQMNFTDVEFIFTRNNPKNLVEIVEMATDLTGIISNETQLDLLPMVDKDQELKRLEQEKKQQSEEMNLFDFNSVRQQSDNIIE